jgi:hypothetical protein
MDHRQRCALAPQVVGYVHVVSLLNCWWIARARLARAGLVASFVEQRPQHGVLQSLGGRRIVEHPLERIPDVRKSSM